MVQPICPFIASIKLLERNEDTIKQQVQIAINLLFFLWLSSNYVTNIYGSPTQLLLQSDGNIGRTRNMWVVFVHTKI